MKRIKMKKIRLTIVFLCILQTLFSQNVSFDLFKANKDQNSFFNYSFFLEEKKVNEELYTRGYTGNLEVKYYYTLDSIYLRIINQHELFLKDSITLIVKPREKHWIEKKGVESLSLLCLKKTNYILTDSINPRNSTSWNMSKEEYIYKDTVLRYEYYEKNNEHKELFQTFYFTDNNKIPLRKIHYYKYDSASSVYMLEAPVYDNEFSYIIRKPSIKRVKVLSDNEVKPFIKIIKVKLINENLYYGKVDNEIDNNFIISLTQYQQKYGLPIGQFDLETMKKLNIK